LVIDKFTVTRPTLSKKRKISDDLEKKRVDDYFRENLKACHRRSATPTEY